MSLWLNCFGFIYFFLCIVASSLFDCAPFTEHTHSLTALSSIGGLNLPYHTKKKTATTITTLESLFLLFCILWAHLSRSHRITVSLSISIFSCILLVHNFLSYVCSVFILRATFAHTNSLTNAICSPLANVHRVLWVCACSPHCYCWYQNGAAAIAVAATLPLPYWIVVGTSAWL